MRWCQGLLFTIVYFDGYHRISQLASRIFNKFTYTTFRLYLSLSGESFQYIYYLLLLRCDYTCDAMRCRTGLSLSDADVCVICASVCCALWWVVVDIIIYSSDYLYIYGGFVQFGQNERIARTILWFSIWCCLEFVQMLNAELCVYVCYVCVLVKFSTRRRYNKIHIEGVGFALYFMVNYAAASAPAS